MVVRTGTAVAPRPGSSANRTPTTAVGGTWVRVSDSASRDGRSSMGAARIAAVPVSREARRAATSVSALTITIRTSPPTPSTRPSNATPGVSSAVRARPTGLRGESATAIPNANAAPSPATTRPRTNATRVSCPDVMPMARSTE